MKLPEVVFVKHCPNLAPERKVFLEEHLKERVPIKDVRWVEDYNHDHPFVQWLNIKLKLPYGLKLTSNFVKTLMMLKDIVDEDIPSALMIDDDVTFHKDWVKILESIPDVVEKNTFINLGTSPFFNLKPELGQVYQLPNNGGCEGMWCSNAFAHEFLNDLNMNEAIDIVFHGFMNSHKRPILNIPLCHQTSDIEKVSVLDHESRQTQIHWSEFVKNYDRVKKIDFNNLCEEYKKFEIKKKQVEDKFEELYGKRIDIKNVKYILNEDHDHKLNILEFS